MVEAFGGALILGRPEDTATERQRRGDVTASHEPRRRRAAKTRINAAAPGFSVTQCDFTIRLVR